MGPINLVLWAGGVVLMWIGYSRARGPWARYQDLKVQNENPPPPPDARAPYPPSVLAQPSRRCSTAVQRSMTIDRPPAAAIAAASQLTPPSWSHRHWAPIATASRAWSTHSSGRRKTSTMSTDPVAATASASVAKAGRPRTVVSFGFTGTQSNPALRRYSNTPNDGRAGFDDAHTTAIR